jgi:hypothetical protein
MVGVRSIKEITRNGQPSNRHVGNSRFGMVHFKASFLYILFRSRHYVIYPSPTTKLKRWVIHTVILVGYR